MSRDDSGLCCCCVGLAIGYMLWYGDHAHGTELKKLNNNLEGAVSTETSINNPVPSNFVLRQIHRYQEDIGPRMKAAVGREDICRYEPSCSEYAKQAVEKHGQIKGSLMAATRLARCNPLSKGGYDPVN